MAEFWTSAAGALHNNYRQMNMKAFISTLSVVLLGAAAFARLVESWPYDKLTEKADLIIIATPVSVHETAEKTTLPNIVRTDTNNVRSAIPAIGVETTFTILSILKGDTNISTFVFHHLREADKRGPGFNEPQLVAFDPKENKRFLLFLKREPDGRYAPLTGQTDPATGVKDLGAYP
jgi:hypothetical protein